LTPPGAAGQTPADKEKREGRRVIIEMRSTTLIAALAAGMLFSPATAQEFPTKPIRVLTATSAGGTSDIFMRVLGDEIQKRWGQPLIVENRPGGSMNIGGKACADAPNDGYTICILPVETLVYNQFVFKSLPFNPERDFEPITNPFFNTQALVVSTALGVSSLDELAALSKAKAGTLSYTVPSVALQVFMEDWKKRTGADMVRVPFKGGGDAVNGLLTGSTPAAFFGLGNFLPHIESGKVKVLAVDGDQRSPLIPGVPTLRELGYTGNLTRVYFGIVAPAGTPKSIIARLASEFAKIGADRTFRQKRLIEAALEPIFDTPDAFGQFLKNDRIASERLVREAGAEPH
jgi:tripartite-type tricarboxylate transporter receptor subunit TctC